MKHNYIAYYANVFIDQLREEDIERIRGWRNDPSNTIYLRKIPYITSEMQKKWYCRYLENSDEMTFAIREIKDLHRIVGSLSLYHFSNHQVEFGKILIGDPDAHGKGIGFNSLIAVLSIAFEQLNMESVFLHVFEENIPAVTIYKRAGFSVTESHLLDEKMELTMVISKEQFRKEFQHAPYEFS